MMEIFTELSGRRLLDAAPAWAGLQAAADAGIVDALLSGADTSHGLADRLGLDSRATELVLGVLLAYDLVSATEDGLFTASDELHRYDEEAPGGVGFHLRLCGHAPAFLRSGAPLVAMDGTAGQRGDAYKKVAGALRQVFEAPARTTAVALSPVRGRVLDVGAGSGVWSLAVAEANPGVQVTALDLPEVVPLFRAEAAAWGLAGDVDVLAGDYHAVTVPKGVYDLVIVGNVLHLESAPRARSLLARLWSALAPGGRLVVIDALSSGTTARSRIRALYALMLAIRTRRGTVHRRGDVERWLKELGATEVRALTAAGEMPGSGLTDVIVAAAPGRETVP
ncbi:methyltransferase [Actinomadura rubrisoli]|uniref:Methyltransferase domain-containing protein n=1 Tax=Actinomadura rubrisoli TaxID=2530368 RepID=A0A4R5AFC9_9ACTN|nr:class I SAM-dependent methyltransferase [Actinomadura rubrisoli]TDD68672.1 methyltransferase domain-containing protein [Actinomadura rubrisoli]